MVHYLRGVLWGWWLLDCGVLGVLVKKGVVLGVLELFVGICTTLVLFGVK